jgi:hypothetical protein
LFNRVNSNPDDAPRDRFPSPPDAKSFQIKKGKDVLGRLILLRNERVIGTAFSWPVLERTFQTSQLTGVAKIK